MIYLTFSIDGWFIRGAEHRDSTRWEGVQRIPGSTVSRDFKRFIFNPTFFIKEMNHLDS